MADRAYLQSLTKRLANDGKLIKAGWIGLRLAVITLDAPGRQVDDMRLAYMAGAQHLFASIIDTMDPDSEPTEADMKRMQLIDDELSAFTKELELRVAKTKGSA
jgi:hypothetical protein